MAPKAHLEPIHLALMMTEYRRRRVPGGTYFFTVVTHERRRFLDDPVARGALRLAFNGVQAELPFRVDAIVLLPDHLHCLWSLPPGDVDYSNRWNRIKGHFTRSWLAASGVEGDVSTSRSDRRERGVWQRRFFEHTCRDEDDLKRCLDYVHVNPLKHGLVERVRDWPWSSFHRYVRLGEYGPDWGSANEWYGDEWSRFE